MAEGSIYETINKISFRYDPSYSGKLHLKEWYGLAAFSTVISILHILRSIYCIPLYSLQVPLPVHRFCANRFYQSRQLAFTELYKM